MLLQHCSIKTKKQQGLELQKNSSLAGTINKGFFEKRVAFVQS